MKNVLNHSVVLKRKNKTKYKIVRKTHRTKEVLSLYNIKYVTMSLDPSHLFST